MHAVLMKKKVDLSWVAQIQQKGRKDNKTTYTNPTKRQKGQ